jgi:hypothetical protein
MVSQLLFKKLFAFLWNLKINYHFDRNSPLLSTLNQINQVYHSHLFLSTNFYITHFLGGLKNVF